MGNLSDHDHDPLAPGGSSLGVLRPLQSLARRIAPWAVFGLVLVWSWRVTDLAHALPSYDDVLEVVWISSWYDGALRGIHAAQIYPMIFYPAGWYVATYAGGPALLLGLLPLHWLGGPAFAYNVLMLITFAVSFAGMRRLASGLLGALAATVAALLYTFWGFHWSRIIGHMNVSIAVAVLPWMLWSFERALEGGRHSNRWLALTGLLWALAATSSWYFLPMGAVLLGCWVCGRFLGGAIADWRSALRTLLIPAAVGALLSAPFLIDFVRQSAAADAAPYGIAHVSSWDASLNSFPLPSVDHPWLGRLTRAIYHGPTNEPGQANFGLLACILALLALSPALHDRRRWFPVLLVAVTGLLLALGLTLKWDGITVRWEVLRGLDEAIWRLGHFLKPAFFVAEHAPAPFDTAVPLPGLLLSALVPFWERARVFARYALLASLGVYLLTGLGLEQVRRPRGARWVLTALLLFGVLPHPSGNVPFPGASHPAFEWLRNQSMNGQGIVDLDAWQPNLLYLPNRGQTLLATEYHKAPTLAGASSILPAHVAFFDDWLSAHPRAFLEPDFVALLRQLNLRYILLHISGGYARDALQDARQNEDLREVGCFDNSVEPGPWPYPICILEVRPSETPAVNVLLRQGWSGAEAWGSWVEGTEASASWAASMRRPLRLAWDIFPICVPGRPQRVTIEVNGEPLASHQWQECDPWKGDVVIPENLVQIGWNNIVLRPAYAARPSDITDGQNTDSRLLSIGVRQLEVGPAEAP
jgi:hypothetical protein